MMIRRLSFAVLPFAILACGGSLEEGATPGSEGGRSDAEFREEAVSTMHDALLAEILAMRAAAVDLQRAAPTPKDRGWDPALDAAAIASMRDAWIRARTAYEHVEGALAPLFPDLDNSIDARYDDFMTQLEAEGGDADLFDDHGVTGMHAVERILFADVTPPRIVTFEASLPGYRPAAMPASADEADRFQAKLCERLIADIDDMAAQWTPAAIHVAVAYQGLVLLVQEQREKVQKASSSEEESRYSQRTMADLRGNLAGARSVYAMFRPWILAKPGGAEADAGIRAGFDALQAAYDAVPGDAIPEPPATWSAEQPSAADLDSPFGRLYSTVNAAVDPAAPGSMVARMNAAADLLGLADLGGGP